MIASISKQVYEKARKLLIELSELGLPLATEALDPISPQYLQDTITWTAIGARTTESQTHREMSSGLSSPVGFKNGTDGSLDVAVNAMRSAVSGHSFLGINPSGPGSYHQNQGKPVWPCRTSWWWWETELRLRQYRSVRASPREVAATHQHRS